MHRKGVYKFVGKNGAGDGARTKGGQVGQPADGHPGLPKWTEMILLALRHPGTALNDYVRQALQKRRLFPLEGFEDMLGEGAFARAHFNNGEGSCRGDDAGHLRELSGNSLCEDRVDFRGLVNELGELLHTRVDMKSIGARDETKATGGVGPCGRELCCSSWLQEFQAISVKMAKEQGLSLNPSKLAGMCGRLKCCLRYEFQTYAELKRTLPAVGARVESVKGDGVVVRQNILKQTVVVRRAEDNVEVETNLDDLVAPHADA